MNVIRISVRSSYNCSGTFARHETYEGMNQRYWEQRWEHQQTGWDIGGASAPLTKYIDGLSDTQLRILIPGCGNAWEAAYLWQKGFRHVTLVDIAAAPLDAFQQRIPDFPRQHLLHCDFFSLEGTFDLILEQTFFCALAPEMRPRYVAQMSRLLSPQGVLAGLLFNKIFERPGPPFGGTESEYRTLFSPLLEIVSMVPCLHSIPPRMGAELFFEAKLL